MYSLSDGPGQRSALAQGKARAGMVHQGPPAARGVLNEQSAFLERLHVLFTISHVRRANAL